MSFLQPIVKDIYKSFMSRIPISILQGQGLLGYMPSSSMSSAGVTPVRTLLLTICRLHTLLWDMNSISGKKGRGTHKYITEKLIYHQFYFP